MISKNFIAPRLQGRTGNIMFQVAHAYAKSLEYNRQLIIPNSESSTSELESNILKNFNLIDINYDKIENYNLITAPFHFIELNPPSDIIPTQYSGWYQSEKYFKKYSNIIKNSFYPTKEFIDKINNDFNFIKNKNTTVINVRRGDYLTQPTRHPVISKEYIYEALKYIPNCEKYIILSDDLEWCKKNIKLDDTIYVDNYWNWEALWLMSQCNYFIISNSSFSWWGAYLSKEPNKIVISPSVWVGPDITDDMKDIWCQDWIKIPCKYNNGNIILE